MRLVISEKANTAKKIAQFLAEGSVKEGKHRSVPHHTFMWKGEVGRAFDELLEVSNDLADAGEARQDIDLIWGATLTRWVSRATKRYGSAFLSVGRVQSPTLVLIADRERERRVFVPPPYWEIEATLKNGEPFTVRHQTERFEDEARAKRAYENVADTATVVDVEQKSATR